MWNKNQQEIIMIGLNALLDVARYSLDTRVKVEGILTDTIEVVSNPFDEGKNIVGLDNKKKKTGRERERQKVLDRIEDEKDEDIKEALRRGNTVEIIE